MQIMRLSSLKLLFIYSLLYATKTLNHLEIKLEENWQQYLEYKWKQFIFWFYHESKIWNPCLLFLTLAGHTLFLTLSAMKPHKQTKKTAVRLKNRGKKKTKGNKDTKHSLLNLNLHMEWFLWKSRTNKITSKLDEVLVYFLFCLII